MKSKINDIIKFSELDEYIDKPIKVYSSGMIVRLAFSIIAHLDADILIIDEALAVGDISFQKKCFSFLEDFQKNNGTILFVSHSLEQIKKLCNEVIYLKNTNIIIGKPKEICDVYENDLFNRDQEIPNNIKSEFSQTTSSLLMPKNFIFPSYARNYGNFKIKILAAWLTNDKNIAIKESFIYDYLSWNIFVEACENIKDVNFGFSIRTKEGNIILGTNTIQQNKNSIEMLKSDKALVSFQFTNYLGIGNYFLTASVFNGSTDNPEYINRVVDAQMFLNKMDRETSFGLLGIDVKTNIREIKNAI